MADWKCSEASGSGSAGGNFGEVALGQLKTLSIKGLCLSRPPQLLAI
jgi:hypothetical protein